MRFFAPSVTSVYAGECDSLKLRFCPVALTFQQALTNIKDVITKQVLSRVTPAEQADIDGAATLEDLRAALRDIEDNCEMMILFELNEQELPEAPGAPTKRRRQVDVDADIDAKREIDFDLTKDDE
jgi:hypothetical protein